MALPDIDVPFPSQAMSPPKVKQVRNTSYSINPYDALANLPEEPDHELHHDEKRNQSSRPETRNSTSNINISPTEATPLTKTQKKNLKKREARKKEKQSLQASTTPEPPNTTQTPHPAVPQSGAHPLQQALQSARGPLLVHAIVKRQLGVAGLIRKFLSPHNAGDESPRIVLRGHGEQSPVDKDKRDGEMSMMGK